MLVTSIPGGQSWILAFPGECRAARQPPPFPQRPESEQKGPLGNLEVFSTMENNSLPPLFLRTATWLYPENSTETGSPRSLLGRAGVAGGFGGDLGAGFAADWVLPWHLCHQRHFGDADRSSIYQETYFCGFPPAAGGQVEYCLVFHTLRWPRRVPASFNRVWNWFGKLNKAHTKKPPPCHTTCPGAGLGC